MSSFTRLARSSIGKKVLMAISGAGLCGFLVTHLLGNFLIFAGPKAYNTYAHALETNPLLPVAEILLLGCFLVHIGLAFRLTWENWDARPVAYAYEGTGLGSSKGGRNAFNWTMLPTGIWMLVFIVIHLLTFKFTAHWNRADAFDAQGYKDFHGLVITVFSDPKYAFFYMISMGVLALHLRHGFLSMFRSIGAYTTATIELLDTIAIFFAGAIAAGYASLPFWVHFLRGGR